MSTHVGSGFGDGHGDAGCAPANGTCRRGGFGAVARLKREEIALFVDADGTLLDIAMRPDEAVAPSGLVETLDAVWRALDGALAIVSGRRIENLDRIFAPLHLPASGVHGAQMRTRRDAPILVGDTRIIPADVVKSARETADRFPGALVEDKGEAVAVHWRACPQFEEEIHTRLLRGLTRPDAVGLNLLRGHCVFEIKSSHTSKGNAVRAFMAQAPFAHRRPVFVGDDVTDLAGLAAAKLLGGHAYSVSAPLPGADAAFGAPHDVREWLRSLADAPAGSALR